MNIKHIDSVVRMKLCPACSAGMTREIDRSIYQCDRSNCGEIFDFSLLSDAMLHELLDKERNTNRTNVEECIAKETLLNAAAQKL